MFKSIEYSYFYLKFTYISFLLWYLVLNPLKKQEFNFYVLIKFYIMGLAKNRHIEDYGVVPRKAFDLK